MLIKKSQSILSSEITPESIYLRRREFMLGAAALAGLSATPVSAKEPGFEKLRPLNFRKSADPAFSATEALTPLQDVTHYNNFYEFGSDKSDPAANSGRFKPEPWSVVIEGEVDKPGAYALEDLLTGVVLEERIYRLRCVEAWSMVIPWIGFPLSTLLKRVQPTSRAKYVEFTTVQRPEEMPGQRSLTGLIDWPYREGLRIDEAMHPLTLMAVGLYGKALPNQNGAPLRLVVPWKYGFKSSKSIVTIRLMEQQPYTSWNHLAPSEYGFYSNVNPEVDHPRWSQKYERRLPGSLFNPNRIRTLPFNGYAEQVSHLYAGMDLRKFY